MVKLLYLNNFILISTQDFVIRYYFSYRGGIDMASKQELEQYLNFIRESDNYKQCPVKSALFVIGGKMETSYISTVIKKRSGAV